MSRYWGAAPLPEDVPQVAGLLSEDLPRSPGLVSGELADTATRGRCPRCGRRFRVRRDGLLYRHHRWGIKALPWCRGSRLKPVP